MSFDPECYELAEHFLDETATAGEVNALAQHIQTAIEDWLAGSEAEAEAEHAYAEQKRLDNSAP